MNTVKNIVIAVLLLTLSTIGFYYLGYTKYVDSFSGKIIQSEFARLEKLAEGTNRLVHLPKVNYSNNPGVRMSPDVLYSYVNYDVGQNPLGILIPLPKLVWSINFYDAGGNNYYSLDNRQIETNILQIIISSEEQNMERRNDLKKVVAPTSKGVAIIRYVMPNPDMENELNELRKSMQSSLIDLKKQES